MKPTHKQLKWVFTRGGRTEKDIHSYKNRLCLIMWDGYNKQNKFIELPEDGLIDYRMQDGHILLTDN